MHIFIFSHIDDGGDSTLIVLILSIFLEYRFLEAYGQIKLVGSVYWVLE